MPGTSAYDAVVVGSGPNGLAASVVLAREGLSVLLVEAKDTVGGGTRSAELTLPGYVHDVCSAVHPLGLASPFFRTADVVKHGVEWVHPPVCMAHPLDDGTAAFLERSVSDTAATLGEDGAAYRRLMAPLVADWDTLAHELLGPLRIPRHPLPLLRFGRIAIRSVTSLANSVFTGEHARAFLADLGAHSIMPLERASTAAYALMLCAAGHAVGWPLVRRGSQAIADALAQRLESLNGHIVTGTRIRSIEDLPPSRVVLLDVIPREILSIAGSRLSPGYRKQLEANQYGPGVFKVDWALDGPIPWKVSGCQRAGTVHLGGGPEGIVESERAAQRGEHPERPFVILAQPSLFDRTRAPQRKHTAWAYCHVPNGTTCDMTGPIEAQVERFAPGFRDRILARHSMSPVDFERYNPNFVGGDIAGGSQSVWRLFVRPALRHTPYAVPSDGLYICSASTPPGAGVHGMCGYHAARAAYGWLQKGGAGSRWRAGVLWRDAS
ncbi:MAG: phytoene desaturase family protein [Chloroflexota bacterium]